MKNNVAKNTTMLYIMNIAKLIFPMLTLPYLTRVLSVEAYGVVAYVKSVMQYMQLLVDFGFVLSSTKLIVEANNDMKKIGVIVGESIIAKLILCGVGAVILSIMSIAIPILRTNVLYTALSFGVIILSSFLMDYLFRGLEKMHILTIRFVIMKSISTILTFVVVKNDSQLLWIPLLDVLSSMIAALMSIYEAKKIGVCFNKGKLTNIIKTLKESFLYFLSNMATTVFGALTTLIIGVCTSASDVAYWSIVNQLVSAVQSMYSPISDGIYPEMIRSKSLGLIKKMVAFFTPLLIAGTLFVVIFAKYILLIIGGEKYVEATILLRAMSPMLILTFYVFLFGWPMLGAINKVRETTITTVSFAVISIIGLIFMIVTNNLTLIKIAVFRCIMELYLLSSRAAFCFKFRKKVQ